MVQRRVVSGATVGRLLVAHREVHLDLELRRRRTRRVVLVGVLASFLLLKIVDASSAARWLRSCPVPPALT
jgi:hypothetical protein